jgi:tyrosinase
MREQLISFLETPELPTSVPNKDNFFKKGKNLTERVLYLLQSYDSFGPISSNYFFEEQKFANWGSLEDVHNSIHGYVGNGGHMGDPSIAAFDPIFWLHHT